jgi:two-component system NtrC family sensor kinase
MIIVFASFLACVCLLTLIDWWGVASVRQKLIISEHFEDLFNNILEARRYEKNFFFYHDPESLKENVNYINKVVEISNQLKEESLEMVNQMVTIHNAQLELVGLTKSGVQASKPTAG